jgi:hypothetical protein
MRARFLSRFLIAVVAVAAGCKTYKMESTFPPPDYDAQTFEPPPSRQIYGDGLIGTGTPTDGPNSSGGGLGPGQVGPNGMPEGGVPPGPDSGAPADAAVDGAGCHPCNLLAQDCPSAAQACYPSGGGRACCSPAGATGALAPCVDSSQCDRGLLCISGAIEPLCQPICNAANGVCPGGVCRQLAGYPGVGYCSP